MLVRSSPDGHWILWSLGLQHGNLTSGEDFENSGLGALQQVRMTAPSWLPSGGAEHGHSCTLWGRGYRCVPTS